MEIMQFQPKIAGVWAWAELGKVMVFIFTQKYKFSERHDIQKSMLPALHNYATHPPEQWQR